jgi:acetolactate synthase-1/2/3 large subunit
MAEETEGSFHAGRLIARRLREHGVGTLFTLSGGHLFSLYDGCRAEGIAIVDTRHEQTAAFAAEGWAKVTRTLGACALTAGPGVTNGMSAMAAALQNHSPMLVLGGRAPAFRWGQGSLQEIDHVPFVRPLSRLAATAYDPAELPGLLDEAIAAALGPPGGPAFLDVPLDVAFSAVPEAQPGSRRWSKGEEARSEPGSSWEEAQAIRLERAGELLAAARRPVVMAGTDLYWGRGEAELLALAEALQIPVFLNGLGRGSIPADHRLAFSRARGVALRAADVALVVGAPLDFRLGFGGSFGEQTELIVLDSAEPDREHPRRVAVELYGPLPEALAALRESARSGESALRERAHWLAALDEAEASARAEEARGLADERSPLHPMRVYAELAPLLDRDAIVIGDGGDFVSFAGRLVESYAPGCWVDSGPYGCLGSGPGYALAAKLAHPDRQVVLLQGDGAFGFSGLEFDTLVRHGVAVVAILGNNGIWGLEKHPMEALYGWSVAAELQPELRYDRVVEVLGAHGELVRGPGELRGAFERALASGRPALINVLTDPAVAYPRRSNLA